MILKGPLKTPGGDGRFLTWIAPPGWLGTGFETRDGGH